MNPRAANMYKSEFLFLSAFSLVVLNLITLNSSRIWHDRNDISKAYNAGAKVLFTIIQS